MNEQEVKAIMEALNKIRTGKNGAYVSYFEIERILTEQLGESDHECDYVRDIRKVDDLLRWLNKGGDVMDKVLDLLMVNTRLAKHDAEKLRDKILAAQEGESDTQIAKQMVQDAYDDGIIGQQVYIDLMQYNWLNKDGE